MSSSTNKILKQAQQKLNAHVIRHFWRALTLAYPSMCVNDGISIDFRRNMTVEYIQNIATQLMRCPNKLYTASPVFEYWFEPDNRDTPHHLSALTLTKFHNAYVVSFFNPKGKSSMQRKRETEFLHGLANIIEHQYRRPVKVYTYDGNNLQNKDYIGLCQLYSLFYLYEYIQNVKTPSSGSMPVFYNQSYTQGSGMDSQTGVVQPNVMVETIKTKYKQYDNKTLAKFYLTFWPHKHK